MNRVQAIRRILDENPDAFVVLSNGLTAREAVHFHREPRCFYLLHAMGEALSVGLGLAEARPDLHVVVIDGDANALMGLSAWSLMPHARLRYYVLCNGISETTGGQKLPELPPAPAWCEQMAIDPGKETTPNPPAPGDIWRDCCMWLSRNLAGRRESRS